MFGVRAQRNSKKGVYDPRDREPIAPIIEPNNKFDGLLHHDDGTKSFVDGAGKVGGVNESNNYSKIRLFQVMQDQD